MRLGMWQLNGHNILLIETESDFFLLSGLWSDLQMAVASTLIYLKYFHIQKCPIAFGHAKLMGGKHEFPHQNTAHRQNDHWTIGSNAMCHIGNEINN